MAFNKLTEVRFREARSRCVSKGIVADLSSFDCSVSQLLEASVREAVGTAQVEELLPHDFTLDPVKDTEKTHLSDLSDVMKKACKWAICLSFTILGRDTFFS